MSSRFSENLQTACIKCISSHFDRFCAAFCTENKSFALHLEFIQKFYCDKILKRLRDGNQVKNEHLKFLFSKYSSQIDLRLLDSCDSSAIEEILEKYGNLFVKFSMAGIRKFYNSDGFLRHLTKVQHIRLDQTNCSDAALRIISENCTELKHLDLYACTKITDKGLIYLCERKPPLENLNVDLTNVTYKGVAYALKNIPSITHFFFENMPMAIFEATGLNNSVQIECNYERVFSLMNLFVKNNPMRPEIHLTVILKICSKVCPFLKDLYVTEMITDEQLYICSLFENLEVVSLQCSSIVIPQLCINTFLQVRGDKIRDLTLSSFSLSVDVLASSCPNLEYLTLGSPSFLDTKVATINFPCLKVFKLQNALLDEAENQASVACIISSSPNLSELHIVYCKFVEEMSDVILKYPKKLVTLNLRSTLVNAKFIEEILRVHSNLNNLLIENSGISTDEYDDLLDIIDDMQSNVHIVWADYSEAIRQLFTNNDSESFFCDAYSRHVLKL